MRFKNILTYFYAATAVAAVFRIYQVFYTIDGATGFFRSSYTSMGIMLLAAIGAVLISVAVVSLTVHRCPTKLPRIDYFTGILSAVLGLSIFYDVFSISPSAGVPVWQRIILNITGILAGAFFCIYAAKSVKKFKIPALAFIIPTVYWIVRLVYLFTAISSLALITDNIFMLASNIFILLFMFEFAKLANNIDLEKGYKKILATGLIAAFLCVVYALPRLLATLSGLPQHESVSSTVSTLITGLFIYRFVRIYFSGRNLKRHRHKSSVTFMPGDGGNNFYTG